MHDIHRAVASLSCDFVVRTQLREFVASPPEGCEVAVGKNLMVWIVTLTGAPNTVFEGEKYRLRIEFPSVCQARSLIVAHRGLIVAICSRAGLSAQAAVLLFLAADAAASSCVHEW